MTNKNIKINNLIQDIAQKAISNLPLTSEEAALSEIFHEQIAFLVNNKISAIENTIRENLAQEFLRDMEVMENKFSLFGQVVFDPSASTFPDAMQEAAKFKI